MAVADALGWLVLWLIVLSHAPRPIGIAVPVTTAVAVLCAVQRLHRAWWINHRYQFTTWAWGRIAIVLLLVGMILRLMLAA